MVLLNVKLLPLLAPDEPWFFKSPLRVILGLLTLAHT